MTSSPPIVHSHFNTHGEAPQRQLLQWRERVGHIVDVPIARAQLDQGFNGAIDRYVVNDLLFTDSFTDPLQIQRPVARISTDDNRSFAFHVFMSGGIGAVTALYPQRHIAQYDWGILALDLNQPFRMYRPAGRMLNFLVPRALVESVFPDADAIHGRVIADLSPQTRLIFNHLTALGQHLPTMSQNEADSAIRTGAQLLAAAFGKRSGLHGNARAATRAAVFGMVRRYIDTHLHQEELTPEGLLNTLQLPRTTLYRMFDHEGGLATYIRNRRLREAANELARFPHLAVMDIAYGLGFTNHSDFTRAFRRAFDITPQDMRAQVLELQRVEGKSRDRDGGN